MLHYEGEIICSSNFLVCKISQIFDVLETFLTILKNSRKNIDSSSVQCACLRRKPTRQAYVPLCSLQSLIEKADSRWTNNSLQ